MERVLGRNELPLRVDPSQNILSSCGGIMLYYIQLATKVVEHLKDNLILSGIRENSWWVLGRKNHVIVLFEKVWKLTPANPPSTSRLWFLLSSLACLHDSSNFDFTPTGQSNQKSIKEWGKTEFCIHSPLGQAFVIWEVTLLYHRHRCNDYLSKSHIFSPNKKISKVFCRKDLTFFGVMNI